MKKKLLAVVMTVVMTCMMLTGCAKLAPADQTVSALFDLYVKDDASSMQSLLGFSSEEAVKAAFMEDSTNTDMVEGLKTALESAGVEMSDADIQNLTDTMMGMMAKTTCTAEITEESADVTTVTLHVNGYSNTEMQTIMEEASNKMVESITEEDLLLIAEGDMDVFNKYMSGYLNDFVSGIAAMELVAEPVDVVVDCEKLMVEDNGKEIVAWLPSDMQGFASDMDAAIFQQ